MNSPDSRTSPPLKMSPGPGGGTVGDPGGGPGGGLGGDPGEVRLDVQGAPGFPALGLLRSCSSVLSAPALGPLGPLDLVSYYPPWVNRLEADCRSAAEGDPGPVTSHFVPPSSLLYPALCGLVDSDLQREDRFPPLPLALHLPLPLPLPLSQAPRRPRSEKKPTPDDQKDQRYLERRRRNNRAAKKSRDARRAREDQIALRAALFEHENAVLRAQVMTLREETHSLRQLLLHHKTGPHAATPAPGTQAPVIRRTPTPSPRCTL